MAANIETMWVSDTTQLQSTVQSLVAQGGVVQGQGETEVQVYLKKKLNVVVVVVGLILCLVPGIAYLIWYSTADQNQQITVKIGQPGSIHTEHTHWYDEDAIDGASPGTVPPAASAGDQAPPVTGAPPAAPIPPAPPAPLPQTDVPPPPPPVA